MAHNLERVPAATATRKEMIAEPHAADLNGLKPADIAKALHIKVYRKWTVTQIGYQFSEHLICLSFEAHIVHRKL